MRNDEIQVIPTDIFNGVAALCMENGDEAVYVHGLFLECTDIAQSDKPVTGIAERHRDRHNPPPSDVSHPELAHGGNPVSDNPDHKQPDNLSVPCIRGRLQQDGCLFRLQTSRDDIRAAFTEEETRWLEQAFPLILQQMVTMASPGSPEARTPHVFHHNGLTCESGPGPQDTVCLMIYPTSDESPPARGVHT